MPAKVARADWTCPRALITARKISSSGIATYPTSNGSPEAPPPSGHVGVVVAPLDHQQSKLRGVHAVHELAPLVLAASGCRLPARKRPGRGQVGK